MVWFWVLPLPVMPHYIGAARALCNGKTLAFQANDAGSIPAARSKHPDIMLNFWIGLLRQTVAPRAFEFRQARPISFFTNR